MITLVADSGATKCEWRMTGIQKAKSIFTQGISAYFINDDQMEELIRSELLPQLGGRRPEAVHFYGTGNKSKQNVRRVKKVLSRVFDISEVYVYIDLLAAARALCQHDPGVACILGTGSNSCSFDGKKIIYNSPGIGYVLGDEGSGAYLGKKVIQYYLYGIFEKELKEKFTEKYRVDEETILENVYRKPLPNRYLATFAKFLSENRGHYMIENILEDGLNDFFSTHLVRYRESKKYPVHFTGGVAHFFSDVLLRLCEDYGFTAGNILKNPMDGLIRYHK